MQATPDTRTAKEREQDDAAERWRVQERERLRKEKEAKAAGVTSPTPAPTTDAPDDFERKLDEDRRRFDAKVQKQYERDMREANKPLPPVSAPPPMSGDGYANTPNFLNEYERQRLEAERAQQQAYLTKQQEQSARESAFARRVFPIGVTLAIFFIGLTALSMWRFPKSRSIRVHTRNLVIGVIGFISCAALLTYVGGVDVGSGGVRFIALLTVLAILVFAALIFAGVVGLTVSLCTLVLRQSEVEG